MTFYDLYFALQRLLQDQGPIRRNFEITAIKKVEVPPYMFEDAKDFEFWHIESREMIFKIAFKPTNFGGSNKRGIK